MQPFQLRFGPIALGDRRDCTIVELSGRREWRRLWWRVWWAETRPWARSYTRQYLTWRLGQLLAHVAVAEEGVIAACEAMKVLNRAAKRAADHERYEIYRLKQRFIGELLEQFPCVITRHIQRLMCDSCGGTGCRRSWRCGRCTDGVYRSHELLLFTFTVGDREYRWHQPRSQWPQLEVTSEPTPYLDERLRTGREFLEPGLRYETLIQTVATWIDRQGMALGISAPFWKFSTAVADDVRAWRRARADRRERERRRRPTVTLARPTLPRIPSRGAAGALVDADLPF